MRFISELKRRNVLRMAVLYAVAAWLVMQVAEVVMTLADLPGWTGRIVLILVAIGFPIALVLSWFYELTPEGVSRDEDVERSTASAAGRRVDFVIIAMLCSAVILFAWDKWWPDKITDTSIAVMPFVNLSGDPEQEYFADGISEELLNLLARLKPLKVIARSSSFAFKGSNADAATVAERLNVTHVLEGSVRRAGGRARIAAQLIDASDSTRLWSETFDIGLHDIFMVQDQIATTIGVELVGHLFTDDNPLVSPDVIETLSVDAYDEYLRGRELIHARTDEAMAEAVDRLQRSLLADNNFAPAHAQLAIAMLLGGGGSRTAALMHLDRAESLNPNLAAVHAGHALNVLQTTRDPEETIEYTRRTLATSPSDADAINWLQIALGWIGDYAGQDKALERLLAVDPLNIVGRYNYATRLSRQGRFDAAHDAADQIAVDSPRMGNAVHSEIALLYEGRIADAVDWALRSGPDNIHLVAAFTYVGQFSEARRIDPGFNYQVDLAEGLYDQATSEMLARMARRPDHEGPVVRAAETLYHAGRIEEALPLFEKAYTFARKGRPFAEPMPLHKTMWLAHSRRMAGDEPGALAAATVAKRDLVARRSAGRDHQFLYRAEAMIAAFERDLDGTLRALDTAIDNGLRDPAFFADAIFADYEEEPRWTSLRARVDGILAEEHEAVIRLVCFDNPRPDRWQPLPETCEGMHSTLR